MEESVFEEEYPSIPNRTELLPWWIRWGNWLFLITGGIAPVVFALGLMGYDYSVSLYGLTTTDPLSPVGVALLLVYLLNGVTAYGLLTERDWAVNFGIGNALLDILVCTYTTVYMPVRLVVPGTSTFLLNFKWELILLVLFLSKLFLIRSAWKQTPA